MSKSKHFRELNRALGLAAAARAARAVGAGARTGARAGRGGAAAVRARPWRRDGTCGEPAVGARRGRPVASRRRARTAVLLSLPATAAHGRGQGAAAVTPRCYFDANGVFNRQLRLITVISAN